MPIEGIRLCRARCRTKNDGPCMQPAMKDSSRCRMHFSHARKLKKHGGLTILAEKERRQHRALLNEMKAINKNIDESFYGA